MFRRLTLTSLILLILYSIPYSEENDSTLCNSTLNIHANSKALQFQVNSNFQFRSFQGSTISLKYHLSQKRAIRCGISLNGGNSEYNMDRQIIENDSLNSKDLTDNSNISVSITTQYLLYHPAKYSYIFYGLGPIFRCSLSNRYDEIQNNLTGSWELTDSRKQKSSIYYVGLSFVFGTEVFISKSISIHGEYNQELTYQYRSAKDTQPNQVNKSSITGFSFVSNGVNFGCSFYW